MFTFHKFVAMRNNTNSESIHHITVLNLRITYDFFVVLSIMYSYKFVWCRDDLQKNWLIKIVIFGSDWICAHRNAGWH